jgi:carbon starvation protein
MLLLLAGYRFYGRFLARRLGIDDRRPTPACALNDGVDFVPARASLLIGQHFSAIAAAGPIVGPILAGIWFGWLPALLWILLGAILIGGVHDFASLFISIRHRALSIGQIVKEHLSHRSHVLFLAFVWLALVYVIFAFTAITAATFRTVTGGVAYGPGVAAASLLYLLLAVAMGFLLYRWKMNLWLATALCVPLLLLIVWSGPRLPTALLAALGRVSATQWTLLLLLYCFVASVVPLWLLLQPRGYLGGWLLYLTIATGLFGALFGGFDIRYPALNLAGWRSATTGTPLVPVLFITVACGACSGFHGIVASGTTSRQLAREADALPVGYGTMLLEALVAVLALATVMMLAPGAALLKEDPNLVYAGGLARYLERARIPFSVAFPFALLAFSTFVYDTLDVCTRLARYILQELLGLEGRRGAALATAVTLLVPLALLLATGQDGWKVAWPIFGSSNQLLASLILLAIAVWLRHTGRSAWIAIGPMVFMLVMTLWSLRILVLPFCEWGWLVLLRAARAAPPPRDLVSGVCGLVLIILCLLLILEAGRALTRAPAAEPRPR